MIGRYECGEVKPSIEVASKITNALAISLDYLVGNSDQLLDQTVLDRVLDIQKLNEKDKEHLFVMVDAFLRDSKAKKAYS